MATGEHRWTWAAIPLALVLNVVGLFIGGIVRMIYERVLIFMIDGNLIDWITGGVVGKIALSWFPALLQGGIAGAFAVYVCSRIFRRANYEIVAYSLMAIVVSLSAFALIVDFGRHGINYGTAELIASTLGIGLGLFAVQKDISEAN